MSEVPPKCRDVEKPLGFPELAAKLPARHSQLYSFFFPFAPRPPPRSIVLCTDYTDVLAIEYVFFTPSTFSINRVNSKSGLHHKQSFASKKMETPPTSPQRQQSRQRQVLRDIHVSQDGSPHRRRIPSSSDTQTRDLWLKRSVIGGHMKNASKNRHACVNAIGRHDLFLRAHSLQDSSLNEIGDKGNVTKQRIVWMLIPRPNSTGPAESRILRALPNGLTTPPTQQNANMQDRLQRENSLAPLDQRGTGNNWGRNGRLVTSLVSDDKTNNRHGPNVWVFRILGNLRHLSGALTAPDGVAPSYAQLYMCDHSVALQQRMNRNSNLCEDTMRSLQALLTAHHPYAPIYKQAYEILEDLGDVEEAEVRLRVMPGQDHRRYNLPNADEVAVILPGDGSANDNRDIILRNRQADNAPMQRISDIHPAYMPLYYVLLFPCGEHGWHPDLYLNDPEKARPGRLSQTRYYAFRLFQRDGEFSTILRGGRLLQQYMVDAFASADQNRLTYFRRNQRKIRASLYNGLEDAISSQDDNVDLDELGKRFILPSSYIGGLRHMQQRYQDAMTIARYFRKVDLFITVTTNPLWEEITRALLRGQTSYDRPDLVARVFQLKKREIIKELHEDGIFGQCAAYVYTIEFQKRGLPHMHMLIFLKTPLKLLSPDDIDSVIWAKWPDPETQPMLFETVQRCMIHGPCGVLNPRVPCMENKKCTKYFPKPFQPSKSMDTDGYPLYHRPEDGRAYQVGRHMVDNSWIVPYSPYLSAKYDCHINVECAATVKSIKYPFKYIHKGGDHATLQVERDEIKMYIDGRYIGPPESAWRIFHFGLHTQIPNVVRLPVHLAGQHTVTFDAGEDPQEVLERGGQCTKLQAFFAANRDEGRVGELARSHTYQEFPQVFTWKGTAKPPRWGIRKDGWALGRMYFVSPSGGERFYLRTLLTMVKGPRSHEDLYHYQGVRCDTYRQVCLARGILQDDGEWRRCLDEAAEMQTGTRLRHLFVTILLFCNPSEPRALWEEFRVYICDDLAHRLRRMGFEDPTDDDTFDYGLFLLQKLLSESGRSLKDFEMPDPQRDWTSAIDNPLIAEQLAYNQAEERERAAINVDRMNAEQKDAFQQIVESVERKLGKIFFLNGAGGTGKTFVYNTLAHHFRGETCIVLCVASSGIAALLLQGGRTAHSVFKLPIDGLNDESTCSIPKESHRAALIRATKLCIWDEAPMHDRKCHETVDRTLRDLFGNDQLYGGLTMVFGGDPKQILPVVPKGTQEEILDASIFRSYIWRDIVVLTLTQNMRLEAGPDGSNFAKWLLDVGHGTINDDEGALTLPDDMLTGDSNALINSIFPGIRCPTPPPNYFLERSILAAQNGDVDGLNDNILDRMSGERRIFISADKITKEAGADDLQLHDAMPPEYLRSLDASGLALGELSLKVGCPIILLRNLAPSAGLCNGTRLVGS
ncbi:ATP-dependent DNA helicase [Mycena venus]|uniref:ATP-dependent DNA helicase n=1 Tax=Mycena venus TaxID=2733690 RepID=A0A8H7CEC5_9AGAR|nr:ATP-dependent DNA helicase [Mycena venus]